MQTETQGVLPKKTPADRRPAGPQRVYRWVAILSAMVLALASVGTTWSGYQSARWGGQRTLHSQRSSRATIQATHFTELGQQRLSLHVSLFSQWAAARSTGNKLLADFLFDRFPEPLKSATVAWLATQPLTDPTAPATPFDMPNYALPEPAEAERWEATAAAEMDAANAANDISDRYLLFTIIFASVLFFGGISGKFQWQVIDLAMPVLGVLALVVGLVILLTSPIS